jgi:hypothetical protein
MPRRSELPMIDQVVRGEIEINNNTNKRFNRGNSVAAFGGTTTMRKSSMSARNSDLKKGFGTTKITSDTISSTHDTIQTS